MATALDQVTDFPALVDYLREELEWPIVEADFEALTFEYTPEEVGLDSAKVGAGIEIKQLRPLSRAQPWGIFFINLPKKQLSTTILRTLLGNLAPRKRASANPAARAVFEQRDLLFIANTGEAGKRHMDFAHFRTPKEGEHVAPLHVIGWDSEDPERGRAMASAILRDRLHWPDATETIDQWRERWTGAFGRPQRYSVKQSNVLAAEMAALAKRIRARAIELIEVETDKGALRRLHKAFKEALIHDLTPEKFADYYAQTITYGLFSARVSRPSVGFGHDTIHLNVAGTSPFLKEMLSQFLEAGGRKAGSGGDDLDFDALGVGDVVTLLENTDMDAVLADWDNKNPDEDPIVRFYEDFLKLYDPTEKKKRGVFYTPRPVVGFIVRSVDEVLRTEFGLEDGLASTATWGEVIAASKSSPERGGGPAQPVEGAQAESGNSPKGAQEAEGPLHHPATPDGPPPRSGEDRKEITLPAGAKLSDPFLRILDPATGTGTFLVECVDLIHKTMVAKWKKAGKREAEIKALWNDYVPNHLLPRLYGFELMMAPYAIAHVKLGLKLADTGYTFGSDARARIYLTNALEPAQDLDMQLAFMSEALAHEAQAANAAKETRFTVVVGNPPYAGHSSNPSRDAKGKLTHVGEMIRPYFSVDGKPLGEKNSKWLNNDYVKFMRFAEENLLASGTGMLGFITSNSWLNSPTFRGVRASVLQTFPRTWIVDCHGNIKKKERAPDGGPDDGLFEIEEGTNITVGARSAAREIHHLDLFGPLERKLAWCRDSSLAVVHQAIDPAPPLRLLTGKQVAISDYDDWLSLPSIAPVNSVGIVTARDDLAIAFSADEMKEKVERFVSLNIEAARAEFELGKDAQEWKVRSAQQDAKGGLSKKIEPSSILYRPFDKRFTFYTGTSRGFIGRPRTEIMTNMRNVTNVGLATSRGTEIADSWTHVTATDLMVTHHSVSLKEVNYLFPLWLKPQGTETRTLPNIAPAFAARVAALTGLAYDDCVEGPKQGALAGVLPKKAEQVAMFDRPRRERGEPGKSFGPRDLFDYIYAVLHSPAYRARYADYLKSDFARIPLPGSRALFEALVPIGTELVALHLLDDALPILKDPKSVRLAGSGEARIDIAAAKFEAKHDGTDAGAYRGDRMYIGANRWFESVPRAAADFHVGGYQPARKWLKDRAPKSGKPGRVLTAEDILHYRRMIAALTRTAELTPQIDALIEKHGGWPGAFRGMTDEPKAEAAE